MSNDTSVSARVGDELRNAVYRAKLDAELTLRSYQEYRDVMERWDTRLSIFVQVFSLSAVISVIANWWPEGVPALAVACAVLSVVQVNTAMREKRVRLSIAVRRMRRYRDACNSLWRDMEDGVKAGFAVRQEHDALAKDALDLVVDVSDVSVPKGIVKAKYDEICELERSANR